MLKNYIRLARRNLLKNKGFTVINIIGLSIGLACFIAIAMYVADELSYDQYNEKADRIYRVNSDLRFGGTDLNMAVSADPMGQTLKNDYPEVEEYVRFYNSSGSKLIKKGNEFIKEERVTHVDSTLFSVFTLPAIIGNLKTALNEPNTVVVTQSTAERYFGGANDAIGQVLETDDDQDIPYKITAVIEDIPKNSHFNFDFFFSMHNVDYPFGNFLSHNFHTYVLMRPGTNYKVFNQNFEQIIQTYILPQASEYMQIDSMEEFEKGGNRLEYSLIPLTDIHLYSSRGVEMGVNGNIQYVYIFSAVALFILLIACINFINLTTARSSGRAKEVGIRKVLGTKRKSLIYGFLVESISITFLALFFALIMVWLSLGWFNTLAGKEMSISMLLHPFSLIPLLMLPFVVGTLAGIYPAFFLSAFRPLTVLKGKMTSGHKKNNLRNFLVGFQFTTSIALIIATLVIYKQLNYIQTTQVGFDKDQVLIVDNSGIPNPSRVTLRKEIEQQNGIKSTSFAGYLPVSNSSRSDSSFSTEAVMTESNGFNMQNWRIDYDYISTLGMEIIEGRNFSSQFGTDSTAIIINESAAKLAGFDRPIGKKLYTADRDNNPLVYTVIGIVKNFNFSSLRQNIGPVSLRLGNNSWRTAYRLQTSDIAGMIASIKDKYKDVAPEMPFNYSFLDESFDTMYHQERRVGKVALTFAFLAILIACLGLFGLATYIAEQRTKEIGIRKVLGSSVSRIVTMLSKDFLKLVLISFGIAVPIAWWAMEGWLQDFAFRVDLSWWIFAITGLSSMLIALLTLSLQTIRAAMANPVNCLRTE
ncbi:ABC transporter permease [Flagellimonas allohymeniacidonis]|uniref:FtsX-like permease family protein n=1 Tax=Flagellimonas allohymeniacidonis TaxID=2517819 RepID=A0A4Q8QJ69_9FLAO|nr:ABC transporter permease [Allomuricauda hymeniacidonis]TAI48509.1 FtsX-like permease family protein [Allomuricauda hymeniacidonis]